MSDKNREIQELLVDYAEALRDGCIPTFLKSLTREEAQRMASSREFRDDTEIVQILNGVAFANKARTCNVGQFISRVDHEIESRLKRSRTLAQGKLSARGTSMIKPRSKANRPT